MLKFTLDNKLYSSEIIEDTTSIFYFYPDNKNFVLNIQGNLIFSLSI